MKTLVATQNNVSIKVGEYGTYSEVLTLEMYEDNSFKICWNNQQWVSYKAGTKLEVEGVSYP